MTTREYPCQAYRVNFDAFPLSNVRPTWPIIELVAIVAETEKSIITKLPSGNTYCDHRNRFTHHDYVYSLEDAKKLAMEKLADYERRLENKLSAIRINQQWVKDFNHE